MGTCKRWNSYKWMIDREGKIISVKVPNKCISRMGKNIIIDDCEDGNLFQIWIYNLFSHTISPIRNGLIHMTIDKKIGSENGSVKLLPSEYPSPLYQTWEMEEI